MTAHSLGLTATWPHIPIVLKLTPRGQTLHTHTHTSGPSLDKITQEQQTFPVNLT